MVKKRCPARVRCANTPPLWVVPQGELSHGARTLRARCAHGSMFLEYSPSFYPVEQPPQNHNQGPNFCNLQPLLVYQAFLFFVLMLVTGPKSQAPNFCSSRWHIRNF